MNTRLISTSRYIKEICDKSSDKPSHVTNRQRISIQLRFHLVVLFWLVDYTVEFIYGMLQLWSRAWG